MLNSASGCRRSRRWASVVFPVPEGAESTSNRPRWMAGGLVIRRSAPARGSARSPPSARRSARGDLACWLLEPVVLTSRFISWTRKSTAGRRARGWPRSPELREMRREPGGLLGHVRPLGEQRDLLHQPRLVHRRPLESSATLSEGAAGSPPLSSAPAPRPPRRSVATRGSRADRSASSARPRRSRIATSAASAAASAHSARPRPTAEVRRRLLHRTTPGWLEICAAVGVSPSSAARGHGPQRLAPGPGHGRRPRAPRRWPCSRSGARRRPPRPGRSGPRTAFTTAASSAASSRGKAHLHLRCLWLTARTSTEISSSPPRDRPVPKPVMLLSMGAGVLGGAHPPVKARPHGPLAQTTGRYRQEGPGPGSRRSPSVGPVPLPAGTPSGAPGAHR